MSTLGVLLASCSTQKTNLTIQQVSSTILLLPALPYDDFGLPGILLDKLTIFVLVGYN
jgi:hypothetical protein